MPYFNKQHQNWTAQVRVNGAKFRSVHRTKAEAKQWEDVERQKLLNPVTPQLFSQNQTAMPSLYDLAVQYLDYAKGRFACKTYLEKRMAFRLLLQSIDRNTPVSRLHSGQILSHFSKQAQERSGYAANKDRKNLVAAWHWAARYLPGVPKDNPFLVERCPETRTPRRVPSEAEFWAVYDVAESQQDMTMLLAYLHLAARKMELFRLKHEDVDLDRRQIRLFTRKRRDGSDHFDWLPLTNRLHDALRFHLATVSGPWVFPNPKTGEPYIARNQWLSRLCKMAGVKEFGLHGIRHLSASILMAEDVPLLDVQTLLRHANLTTTQRYVHRLKSVRKAVSVFDR